MKIQGHPRLCAAVALLALVSLLLGCQAQSSASPAAPAAAVLTLKLGISMPMTGPNAGNGVVADRYIRMGIDDINAKGGFKVGDKTYKLEAITIDDKNTSDGAIEAANKLVFGEKVKVILGTSGTPWAGGRTVTEPNKILNIATTAVDKFLGKESPLTVVLLSMPSTRGAIVYDWLVKAFPQAKRVATVEGDDANGRQTIEANEARIKSHGLTLATKEFYPLDIKDFGPIVTRLLAQKPDAIDAGVGAARGPMFLALVKELNVQKFTGPILAASIDQNTVRDFPELLEGVTSPFLITHNSPQLSDGEKDVFARYVKQFGEKEVIPGIIVVYNGPTLLAQAAAKAGTVDDTEKLAATLRSGEWDTIYGKTTFQGAKTFGMPTLLRQPVYLNGIRNGKIVILDKLWTDVP